MSALRVRVCVLSRECINDLISSLESRAIMFPTQLTQYIMEKVQE